MLRALVSRLVRAFKRVVKAACTFHIERYRRRPFKPFSIADRALDPPDKSAERGALLNNDHGHVERMMFDHLAFTQVWLKAPELEDTILLQPMHEAARIPSTTLSVFVRTNLFQESEKEYTEQRFYAGPSYISWSRHLEASPGYDGHYRDPLTNLSVESSDFGLVIEGAGLPILMGKLENKPLEEMAKPMKSLLLVMTHYMNNPEPTTGEKELLGYVKQLALAAMLCYGPDQLYTVTSGESVFGESACNNGMDSTAGIVLAATIHRRLDGKSEDLKRVYLAATGILMGPLFVNEASPGALQAVEYQLDDLYKTTGSALALSPTLPIDSTQ